MNNNTELYHYGVKGMKWGVKKRYLNSDGSLNNRGIKKYAKKGYAKDAYNSNKSRAGKIYDRLTDAHKHSADIQYGSSSKAQNKARAEKYLREMGNQRVSATKRKASKGESIAKRYLNSKSKIPFGAKSGPKKPNLPYGSKSGPNAKVPSFIDRNVAR